VLEQKAAWKYVYIAKINNIMLRNKNKRAILKRNDTKSISELNDFFTSSEIVCDTVLWIIRSLKLKAGGLNYSNLIVQFMGRAVS
jgi:hypothetical protein